MYKLIIVVLVLFTINCEANEFDYNQIEKNLNNYEKKIQVLKQSIDNSVFDDTEILINLDFETDLIIGFVKDKIVFQPYQGLLRGIQGTINSRAGNALDQSVLLAKLLNDAGLEARIATGQLSEQLTLQMLLGISHVDIPDHIGQGIEFEKAIKSITPRNREKVDWKKTETYARYLQSLESLNKTLKNNNISFENHDITSQLVEQNKEYFWVQYRSNFSQEWQEAHPAFNQKISSSLDIKPKVQKTFKESVPEKYHHQLKIEAFIEQRVNNTTKKYSLMKPWIKPVANLQDQLITYSNAPSGTNLKSEYNLAEVLDKSTYFAPTFNGANVGGKVFDLKGRLVDAFAMSDPAGALFQTLGDKTLSAIDQISSTGKSADTEKKQETMQLTSQWLEFTFMYPDGTEYVQKRFIYQAPTNQKVDELTVKTQLMSEYSLLVNSGEKPNAYLAKVYLDLIESGLPLLKSSARKVFNPDQKVGFPKQISQNEFELLTQYHWMQQNPDKNKDVIQFRSKANLLGFKRGYVDPETAFLAVDIISNKQEFFQKSNNKLFINPQAAFTQGIWETASEWMPPKISGITGDGIDTLKVSSTAQKQNISMQILKSQEKNDDKITRIFQQDLISTDRVRSDLDLGYMVIVPSQKPNGLKMSGWWRINLKTGETLGMTSDGGGQSATEYAIDIVAQQLALIRAIGNLKKCTDNQSLNNYEKMCCLAEAHINNVAGLAFGGALGATVGSAGAALFDIVDFTVETITGSGIAPSTNGSFCKSLGPIPTF